MRGVLRRGAQRRVVVDNHRHGVVRIGVLDGHAPIIENHCMTREIHAFATAAAAANTVHTAPRACIYDCALWVILQWLGQVGCALLIHQQLLAQHVLLLLLLQLGRRAHECARAQCGRCVERSVVLWWGALLRRAVADFRAGCFGGLKWRNIWEWGGY